eukprot:9467453-Pyramimonas_sp.AAC.1
MGRPSARCNCRRSLSGEPCPLERCGPQNLEHPSPPPSAWPSAAPCLWPALGGGPCEGLRAELAACGLAARNAWAASRAVPR